MSPSASHQNVFDRPSKETALSVVVRFGRPHREVHRGCLVGGDPDARVPSLFGALLQQPEHVAGPAAATVRPLPENEVVEEGRRGSPDLADVVVAAIARHADDADDPAVCRTQSFDELAERTDRGRVVAVVEDRGEPVLRRHIQPAGVVLEVALESAERVSDHVRRHALRVRGERCGQRIRHVESRRAAQRRRDLCGGEEDMALISIVDDQDVALLERRDEIEAVGPPPHREVGNPSAGVPRHRADEGVVGIQHARAATADRPHHHRLDPRELFDRVDAAEAEVVSGDIEHDADVVPVEAQPLSE